MKPDSGPPRTAASFQLLEAIDAYAPGVETLARAWDAALYTDLSLRFDEMRIHAASLPDLSVPWVEVLITRFQFTDELWRSRDGADRERTVRLHAAHMQALAALRECCRRDSGS